MSGFSENHLQNFQNEFNSLDSYHARLVYFDKLFKVIPFNFPVFTPELSILFDRDHIQELIRILVKERSRKTLFQRELFFKDDTYLFTISPPESATEVYNNFVITQFLKNSADPDALIRARTKSSGNTIETYTGLLEKAHSLINTIEQHIHRPGKTTYQNTFFKDFYKGYAAAGDTHLPDLHAVRKLLELYLYTQGILFYRYMHALESLISPTGDTAVCNCESESHCEQIRLKIELLKDTGIINFLTEKFTAASSKDVKKDVAETLCSLIDELNPQKGYVLSQI